MTPSCEICIYLYDQTDYYYMNMYENLSTRRSNKLMAHIKSVGSSVAPPPSESRQGGQLLVGAVTLMHEATSDATWTAVQVSSQVLQWCDTSERGSEGDR